MNGAVGDACSQGTGRASVGFDDGSTITWFDNVFGVYVPQLAEPLAGATWSIANLGISTIMAPEGTFIRLPNGSVIPLSLEGNVTRCKHIILGRNAQPLRTPVPLLASPLAPFCDQTRRGQVSAKASNVVDATRGYLLRHEVNCSLSRGRASAVGWLLNRWLAFQRQPWGARAHRRCQSSIRT